MFPYALYAVALLGDAVIFGLVAVISLVVFRRPHRISSFISAACGIGFGSLFLIPPYVAARARTPQDHLRAAYAFANRAQFFPDDSAAWRHLLIAAEGGLAEAQFAVGEAYLYRHHGITRDRAEARRWLSAAAQQGHIGATRDLPNVDTIP